MKAVFSFPQGARGRACGLFCALSALILMALPEESGAKDPENWSDAELAKLKENFQSVDTDKNGIISIQELAAIQEGKFKSMDKNGDGFLTIGEFVGFRGPTAGRYLTATEYKRRQWSFYRLDFDLDRKVNIEEFLYSVNQQFFNLDRDNNGKVTFEEFTRLPLTRRSEPRGG